MNRYEPARAYAARGWRVIALHHLGDDGYCTCHRHAACGRNAAKHPLDSSWQKSEAPSSADLYTLFGEGDANIGIVTGEPSGIWVLDIDPKDDGPATLDALEAKHGPLPETYTVTTGSGGTHYYFALGEESVRSTESTLGAGIDTRGRGGQVVAPPSVSGVGAYTLAKDAPLAEAPAWLVEALRERPTPVPLADAAPPAVADAWLTALLAGTAEDLRVLGEGEGWDDGTFKVAIRLAEIALSDWNPLTLEQAHSHLHAHAPSRWSRRASGSTRGCPRTWRPSGRAR